MKDEPIKNFVTIGIQSGDEDSSNAVSEIILNLRKLFNQKMDKRYIQEVDEFSFVLRVDGKFSYWNFEGCEKLRIRKKDKYITIDIGVTKRIWQNFEVNELKEYLSNCILDGFNQFVKKFKKEKFIVQDELLIQDVKKILEIWRSLPTKSESD